jgi:putative transposase
LARAQRAREVVALMSVTGSEICSQMLSGFFGKNGPGRDGRLAAKKSRFSVEQISAVLKQAEAGIPVVELIRKVGISEQTFYRWKKIYGGLDPSHAHELKQLREENSKLKRLVADPADRLRGYHNHHF